MKKLIVILCGVIWASEAVAVTQIIPAGEDVTGGDVHTVVTQQGYGTGSRMLRPAVCLIIRM